MATITKTQSGAFKVQIRKSGISSITKTCKTKADAQKWARLIGSEIDRGVFIYSLFLILVLEKGFKIIDTTRNG